MHVSSEQHGIDGLFAILTLQMLLNLLVLSHDYVIQCTRAHHFHHVHTLTHLLNDARCYSECNSNRFRFLLDLWINYTKTTAQRKTKKHSTAYAQCERMRKENHRFSILFNVNVCLGVRQSISWSAQKGVRSNACNRDKFPRKRHIDFVHFLSSWMLKTRWNCFSDVKLSFCRERKGRKTPKQNINRSIRNRIKSNLKFKFHWIMNGI